MKTNKKTIAIIGAGITGLAAAYELGKKGYRVTIFERSDTPGGLGTYLRIGPSYLERFYHHFFQSDKYLLQLVNELGLDDKLHFYRVKTGIYSNSRIFPFSSAKDLLTFQPLPFLDRVRCGIIVAIIKAFPFEIKSLDTISAADFIKKYMGNSTYNIIWGPLLEGKFAEYYKSIPALWLWWRIRDRTLKLGYFENSAKTLFDTLINHIKAKRGILILNAEVTSIESVNSGVSIMVDKKIKRFDSCLITTVSPIAQKLIKNPMDIKTKQSLSSQDQLGAVCVILELKHSVQSQYWLNICKRKANVLVIVEHTNLIDKKEYGGNVIMYLANYLHRTHKRFKQSDSEIIKEYTDFLKKINPDFSNSWIIKAHVSKVPRAQTIFYHDSLNTRPPHILPVKNIYLANIDQMYPHDRNLNLGIMLGKRLANIIK